jgi:hypothetical protein
LELIFLGNNWKDIGWYLFWPFPPILMNNQACCSYIFCVCTIIELIVETFQDWTCDQTMNFYVDSLVLLDAVLPLIGIWYAWQGDQVLLILMWQGDSAYGLPGKETLLSAHWLQAAWHTRSWTEAVSSPCHQGAKKKTTTYKYSWATAGPRLSWSISYRAHTA